MSTKKPSKAVEKAVTRAEFSELSSNVSELVKLMTERLPVGQPLGVIAGGGGTSGLAAPLLPPAGTTPDSTVPVKPQEPADEQPEVKKAAPNRYQVNEQWDEMAHEVIGEAVDHTEIEYLKGGGLLFTVVIKEEFSNAPGEYMERHKVDRRSREVGAEGEAGVKVWCELIKSNLNRLNAKT